MKKKFATEAHAEADSILKEIAGAEAKLDALTAEAEKQIAGIKKSLALQAEPLATSLKLHQKELQRCAKRSHADLFPGKADKASLPNGVIIFELKKKVRHARGVTPETLETLGFPDVVIIAKSIDWDAIEKWPDNDLLEIGTDRREKKSYAYELTGGERKKA